MIIVMILLFSVNGKKKERKKTNNLENSNIFSSAER